MEPQQYLLFGGEAYYAEGGFNDFRGSFNSLEEARNEAIICKLYPDYPDSKRVLEWWHIVHTDTNTIVEKSETLPYGVYS